MIYFHIYLSQEENARLNIKMNIYDIKKRQNYNIIVILNYSSYELNNCNFRTNHIFQGLYVYLSIVDIRIY